MLKPKIRNPQRRNEGREFLWDIDAHMGEFLLK